MIKDLFIALQLLQLQTLSTTCNPFGAPPRRNAVWFEVVNRIEPFTIVPKAKGFPSPPMLTPYRTSKLAPTLK